MLPLDTFKLVPLSMLLLVATAPTFIQALDNPWPFGLGFFAWIKIGHASLTRTDRIAVIHHVTQVPIAVRKMSGDQGEMFFPEYWRFEPETNGGSKLELDREIPISRSSGPLEGQLSVDSWANASIPQPLQAPYSLHTSHQLHTRPLLRRILRSPAAIFALDSRDFACPNGTSVCTSINRPNSCCATGLVCQLTTDAGQGDVGCCQSGQVCGEQVSGCPAQDTLCPDSLGGGCCIPGSVCNGVGCESKSCSAQITHDTNF